MYLRADDRRAQAGTGFALRIATLGGLALILFGVVFFRLWQMQVLSGEEYLAEANDNRTREIRVGAPRGDILDAGGKVLVGNRTSLALQVNPQKLPADPTARRARLARIGRLVDMPPRRVRRIMHSELRAAPNAPVTLRRDVDHDLVYYLQEHKAEFPAAGVQRVFVRRYPRGTLAAHLVGSVGEIDEDQLGERRYSRLEPGDEIGRDGVEHTYDSFLRGRAGMTRIQVDSLGRPKGQLSEIPPAPGNSLRLTIDSELQAAGEGALSGAGLPGAFVAMNVRDGSILAMGSNPTFDPSILTKPLTQAQVNDLYRDPVAAPIINRAIAAGYPTGSTYKLITAVAALESGVLTPTEAIYDDGLFVLGGVEFRNAGDAAYGSLTLQPALQFSSDVFFYTLGDRMSQAGDGLALQRWSRKLGIGRETGIDLPGEEAGLLPTPAWRNELFREGGADRPWSGGDNVNFSVGQGDLQAHPLQMAVAYATVANGGTVVRPHLGLQVEDAAGRVVREIDPRPMRQVSIDPAWSDVILAGLHDAAQSTGGTSYGVFGGFPVPVAGKTGTAERFGHGDQSWYVALAPYPDPEVVVAATFEEGGFGADTAAPAVAQILSEYFDEEAKPVEDAAAPIE